MDKNLDSSFIKDIQEIDQTEVDIFGRKAVCLAMMSRKGVIIPKGFCVSDQMLRSIFPETPIPFQNKDDFQSNHALFNQILEKSIYMFGDWENNKKLVVRSSASMEDSIKSSYAGIFRSEVDINNQTQLYNALKLCWESQFHPNVQKYSSRINEDINHLRLGIIIQEMIEGDFSGVVFTKNPMKPKSNEMLIEAYWGQCGPIVQGIVNPYRYYIDRGDYKISRHNQCIDFQDPEIENGYFLENILLTLINTSVKLEKIFFIPQDIEWTTKDGELFILQSRPITNID